MTREQIEQWARESGIYPVYSGETAMQDKVDALNAQHLAQVERFAALVAAHEREPAEADAKRYQWLRSHQHVNDGGDGWLYFDFDCKPSYADMQPDQRGDALDSAIDSAIRARGEVTPSR